MAQKKDRAADLVIALARRVNTRFERYGYILPAQEALQSEDVVRCLLKMAVFSLNMQAVRRPGEKVSSADVPEVPEVLAGAAMHYVMQVAPFVGDRGGDETLVNVDDLVAHVAYIEAHHGEILIDPSMIDLISSRVEETVAPSAAVSGGPQEEHLK